MTAGLLAGTLFAVGACGSTSSGGGSTSVAGTVTTGSRTVDVYSSLPLHGTSASQSGAIVNGIKLALAEARGHAGSFAIDYQSLDDSTADAAGWDAKKTAANARRVAADPKAMLYIGDFDSGASEVSIPILNQAGIPQVSPVNTYVGLTTGGPGSAFEEPGKYYPAGDRTFTRIVPRDTVQAAAGLLAMRHEGCSKVAVANDRDTYGQGLATLLEWEKSRYGVTIVSNTALDPSAGSYRSYARMIKGHGADCFYYAGDLSGGAVQVTKDVGAVLPGAKIFGGDGICTRAFTSAGLGGVPAPVAARIRCTLANPAPAAAGVPRFLAAYRARYGIEPDPRAIYGYEAMKLALDTISGLGARGNERSAVLGALFATKDRVSVLGTYGFDANGDTTLRSYGLYEVDKQGTPVLQRVITP